jgi:ABC-type multidrug transport system fused ATPase/permease subunit
LILVFTIPLVTTGQISGVFLGTLILAALASFEAAQQMPQAARSLQRGLAAANRLNEILDAKPTVSDPKSPLPIPKVNRIEIKDLFFAYPSADQYQQATYAIDGINLGLFPVKCLALVGPSGAGKTTLANLLLRFWDYDQGSILVGEHELHSFNQDDIRASIGVVSQRTHLYNSTIGENLLIAKPDAGIEEIKEACQLAQIDEYIESLPQKYETWIGEGGMRLSAGERQRLAIARVLLKNAPLLILDEPTTYLDPLTEIELLRALFSLMEDRSTLWITHRLTGMETMDEILVMDRGQIVERGNHFELLDKRGLYSRMWELQQQTL